MTIPGLRSFDHAGALLMPKKWCWVHGDLLVSTQWRSPPAELPLQLPPPHLKDGRTPQWCYLGACKTKGKAWLGTIKQAKFEKKTFESHCQQVATRTRSRLKRQLRVRSTPKLSRCYYLQCGHYILDLQLRLTIVTMVHVRVGCLHKLLVRVCKVVVLPCAALFSRFDHAIQLCILIPPKSGSSWISKLKAPQVEGSKGI